MKWVTMFDPKQTQPNKWARRPSGINGTGDFWLEVWEYLILLGGLISLAACTAA